MIYPQMLLDLNREIIVDLFAGGGGASCGIEMALGRTVDVAVNHDPAAVAMHRINHPQTRHLTSDVFEVDPREVTRGRPVGLLWASPDCTHHSKARGGKPLRDAARKRRALAWVVTRWAAQVRPRVILLENVEEFQGWGPLVGPPDALRPCPKRKGRTFRRWVRSLERLSYRVEWRELRASDYGAPTIRKRLFVIARCDGRPIRWPKPTHGPDTGRPYRTAAECIDWTIPMLSIFATREEARVWGKAHGQSSPVRPLADATMRRIARGVMRYVVESPAPFIVPNNTNNAPHSVYSPLPTVTGGGRNILAVPYLTEHANASQQRIFAADEPLRTQVSGVKGGHFSLVAPVISQLAHGEGSGSTRRWGIGASEYTDPLPTVHAGGNSHALVAGFLAKHYGGVVGSPLDAPKGTVTTVDHDSLVAGTLTKLRGTSHDADPQHPLHTISAGGTHHGAVAAFLQKYYGQGVGQELGEPVHTIPTKDRMGLVTVDVAGEPYVIADIAMRMLQPGELYRCQGFPAGYVYDRGAGGRKLTKTEQVRMCGNSVCPPIAAALVRANVPDMIVRDEARPAVPKKRARRKAVLA